MRYIIVGGVAAGATFATRLRRLDEKAEIVIYEKTGYISYATCGLPYYIGGAIKDRGALTIETPEHMKARYNVLAFVNHEVTRIDKVNKTVEVKDLRDGTIKIDHYDKLILCPGAASIKVAPEEGRVFGLRNIEDADRMLSFIESKRPSSAIVVGGGFIGLETLENLAMRGIEVTLVEGSNHILPNLDEDMARIPEGMMRQGGIKVLTGVRVREISQGGDSVTAHTDLGDLQADMLVQSIGVRPASALAKDALMGIEEKGSIKVDNLQEVEEDVYALGDATSRPDFFSENRAYVALAGLANKDARSLATHLSLGEEQGAMKPLGTSILKLFNIAIGSVGLTEAKAKALGKEYGKAYLSAANHATYYPGAGELLIKALFDKNTGEILGAQIIGGEGVDKRIDVLSLSIRHHLTYLDLKNEELSYAPPFGAVRDPINALGCLIEDLFKGLSTQVYPEDVEALVKTNVQVVDVRTPMEFGAGHIEGAINIPVDELRGRMGEIDKSRPVLLICHSGLRSYVAMRVLKQYGYDCSHLAGGWRFYKAFGH